MSPEIIALFEVMLPEVSTEKPPLIVVYPVNVILLALIDTVSGDCCIAEITLSESTSFETEVLKPFDVCSNEEIVLSPTERFAIKPSKDSPIYFCLFDVLFYLPAAPAFLLIFREIGFRIKFIRQIAYP